MSHSPGQFDLTRDELDAYNRYVAATYDKCGNLRALVEHIRQQGRPVHEVVNEYLRYKVGNDA